MPSGATAADPPADGDDGDAAAPSVPEGALLVTSPSPGILWRSPMPGAPPFAEVGQTVETSDTVCIIEVMKLMNHVKAGVAGTVVAALVANGAQVSKDEPTLRDSSRSSSTLLRTGDGSCTTTRPHRQSG